MAGAKCVECGWEVRDLPTGTGTSAWLNHRASIHGEGAPITQLPGVDFHAQALLAIRTLAETGRDFTIGECHPMVGVPPLDPARDWPRATNEAKRLGWIERVDYAQSVVAGTNRSAVAVWRGTYAATRRAA
jgi:hypothetical protein